VITATSPTPEDLAALNEALGDAHAAIDETETAADFALDAVETARDRHREAFGTAGATSNFGDSLSDLHVARRALTDVLRNLPPIDEGATEEEGSTSEA
jgi:hypothetical protein